MTRSPWLTFALAALGLWASLVPQVSYPSASSGQSSNDALIAWPGWAIQQDLGFIHGTVGTFRYWASAEADGPEVSVHASLVDATSLEVLRQKSVVITPAYIPVERTLTLPSYVVPPGQRLLLQFQVADSEEHYVVFQLAVLKPELDSLRVNGVPNAADGPLAFVHIETGSGFRAALQGEQASRARLALAVAMSALAVLVSPWSLARLRQAKVTAHRLIGGHRARGTDRPGPIARVLATPWYPWPAVAVPILHFLANNDIHFAPGETVVPLLIALLTVCGVMIGLRLVLNDWHRPAAVTTVVIVVFFAYGHVEQALNGRLDERLFFAVAVVLAAAATVQAARSGGFFTSGTQFFNVVVAVLLLLQVAGVVGGALSLVGSPASRTSTDNLANHVFPTGIPPVAADRPDIYYIILDAYGRNDALVDFDNSAFLRELEAREFYIASEATSNYNATPHSLASSLNMSYLHTLGDRTPARYTDIRDLVFYNSLAAILKSLGYTYVHLESGHQFTSKAPLADVFVSFGPSGVRVLSNRDDLSSSINPLVSRVFARELIRTTALRPVIETQLLSDDESTYDWWSPHRALDMIGFLSKPIVTEGPKFVFAHISKPKVPATFDRHGNYVLGTLATDEFSDDHDPSVPDAYTGQLIYINSLVLQLIDDIMRNDDGDPIILIAGDHNRRGSDRRGNERPLHPILAAFRIPGEADRKPPASISSVNHFRYILRTHFDMDIDLLEDRTITHSGVHWDFTSRPEGKEA